MKIVYIAHPISGDIDKNIANVIRIVREINLHSHEVVPFAPYIADCLAMDDDIMEHRERGIKNDVELLKRGFIDEIWLFGDRISGGMSMEIQFAFDNNIPVIAKTPGTSAQLDEIERELDREFIDELMEDAIDKILDDNLE